MRVRLKHVESFFGLHLKKQMSCYIWRVVILTEGEMAPLQGQTLATFQESMYFIRYILIDEMSFIGPKLLQQIDNRLHEAFPSQNQIPFGG